MEKYCNNSWKTIVEILASDIYKGLSESECDQRRKAYGDNKIYLPKGNSKVSTYIKLFLSLYLFVSIAVISFLFYRQEYIMGIITLAMILVNASIKLVHVYKRQKEVGFLQNINYATITVIRDGKEKIIKAEELVKGDIVLFSKGSLIAADIRIIEAKDIKVDEKNITGESFLKDKFESKIDGNISAITEMKNILFKGSVIKEGAGAGIVIETGNSTQLGRLLAMLVYANNSKHTLDSKLEKPLGRIMITLSIVAIGFFFIFNNYSQGLENLELSLFSIQVFPIGAVVLLYVKFMKKDLLKEGIELINISTVDLINDIEILFLDKIGSITKEKMVVRKIYSNNVLYEDKNVNYNKDINIKRLIDILLLSNNAVYNVKDDSGSGDLSEIAYLSFAAKKLAYKSVLDSKFKRVFEIPMDSDKRILTTLNKSKKGCRANVKGNVDTILERCTHIMIDGLEKEISEEDIQRIKDIDFNFSLEGLATQAAAYRSFSYNPSVSENIESNLVFVGIVGLENPLNENIKEQITDIKSRGILPILFTEDNKITATTIGKKAGLISNSAGVISGVELDSMNREELIDTLSKVRVFSRVNPEIKGRIVGLFTKDNYSVAASGETLGDLASLSLSKVGIGKGKAPEIVKKVSDIFIKENYLRGFISIFDISKKFQERATKSISTLIALAISEIVIINIFPLINSSGEIEMIPLAIINILLAPPISLVLLRVDGEEFKRKKYIVRTILWSLLTLGAIYGVDGRYAEVILLTLGGIFIEYTLLSSKIKFKGLSIEALLFLTTIFIWIISAGILVSINSLLFSTFQVVKLIGILVSYIIIELIMKRWQG
ncbi:cation-transporting P-type ATPase [Clostridium sp. LP20]|uniref:P-type ATPase n=1 Tax=Clostridium sp. LP20 TaxID=3418665 RepID=UPI003EE476E4